MSNRCILSNYKVWSCLIFLIQGIMFYLSNFRQERVDMQFEGLQKNMYRLKTPLELTCQLLRAVTYSVLYGVWRHLCQSRKEVVLLNRQLLVIKLILSSHGLGLDSWGPCIKGVVLSFPSQQNQVRKGNVLLVCCGLALTAMSKSGREASCCLPGTLCPSQRWWRCEAVHLFSIISLCKCPQGNVEGQQLWPVLYHCVWVWGSLHPM